jgi:hypothetical protein
MSEEVDCFSDALLTDVVRQAKAVRQTLCETYSNPEEAWMDGFVAGWFEGHFKRTACEPITEPLFVANRTE